MVIFKQEKILVADLKPEQTTTTIYSTLGELENNNSAHQELAGQQSYA
ncbi:7908_t:CDS:2, partial [Racocetra persica]